MKPANLRFKAKGGKARSAAALADKVAHEPHTPALPAGGCFVWGGHTPAFAGLPAVTSPPLRLSDHSKEVTHAHRFYVRIRYRRAPR